MDENREYQIFENYIKSVCRKIMSQKKKNEVREELYSHLLEEYERNSALGLDDETAQLKAIEKMGDQEKIACEFGALYSVIPTEYMRSSLNFIIWGMALTFFQINLFTGFGEITKFIGEMLLIYGLFKLRKTDKKFNSALYLNIALEIYYLVLQNITLYSTDYIKIQIISTFISTPFSLLVYWWIFSGTKKLCKNLIGDKDKQPHLISGFITYTLCTVIVIFAALTELSIVALITPILMIFSLCQLGRAKRILAYKEPEFDLKETLKKSEKIVYWILVIILAVAPAISMLAAASPNVNTTIHNTANIIVEESELDNARNNMLELGFPKEYLKDLPDSEILKYNNATYLQTEGKEDIHKTTLASDKIVVCSSETFNFYYPDGEIRVMMRIEVPEKNVAQYRNGLYLQFYEEYFSPTYDDNSDGDYGQFYLALSEKDGKTFSTEPISEFTPKSPLEKLYISGFEFTFVDGSNNRRAYLAYSAKLKETDRRRVYCTDAVFLWQEIPISAENTSINDMAISEFDDVMTFGGSGIKTIRRWDLYNSFDYYPYYTIKDEMIDFDKK